MHPIGVIILGILVYFVSFGTRRAALAAMVAGVLYLTQGQMIEVGVHLFAVRILSMALFLRVMSRREFSFSNLNRIDRALLMLYGYTTVVFLLRSKAGHAAMVAEALDAFLCYFGFRALVRSEEDLKWLLRALVLLLIPYAFLVGVERIRGGSVFIFMGGITSGWMRDDATRCMGSFRYSVSLGTFAASFLALFIALWHSKADRRLAYWGIVLCAWLVWASNSGGSFSAAGTAVLGWVLWYLRANMQTFRRGVVVVLVILALTMKAPIWYAITHIPFSGDSWHRAYLMDMAFQNIGQWWFAGMSLLQTESWFPYTINGGADITNQYLVYGLNAGIVSMALFIFLLVRTFGQIRLAMRKLKLMAPQDPIGRLTLWGLGVTTTVHVVSWFGVSYFDQMYVIWYLQLAIVASITDRILRLREPKVSEPSLVRKRTREFAESRA